MNGIPAAEQMRWLMERLGRLAGEPSDGCLTDWPYSRDSYGYAHIRHNGRNRRLHAVVLKLTVGPAPIGQQARHLCGRGHLGCFHPGHLVWGTPKQNQDDRLLHGTAGRGDAHSQAKLTEDDVRVIRASTETGASLARRFGVRESGVSQIRSGRSWAHLDDAEEASRRHAERSAERASECPQGHQRTPENIGVLRTTGATYCKECNREKSRRNYQRKKAGVTAPGKSTTQRFTDAEREAQLRAGLA